MSQKLFTKSIFDPEECGDYCERTLDCGPLIDVAVAIAIVMAILILMGVLRW